MKILLATDGSDAARCATDFLIAFPLPADSEITVMTVVEEIIDDHEVGALTDERRQAYRTIKRDADLDARQLVDRDAKRLEQCGVSIDTRACSGAAAEQIVHVANELESDLIVVGSHGLTGIKRFMLGSVSDKVYQSAPCSVLIVKHTATDTESKGAPWAPDHRWRMLLAVDGSTPVSSAVDLCKALPLEGRAEIKAITVMALIHMYRQDVRQHLSWMWQQRKVAAVEKLKSVAGELQSANVPVSTELLEDANVADAILHNAESFDADLIVLGHQRRKVVERWLLGSVTTRIAHHSGCSVLAVRSSK